MTIVELSTEQLEQLADLVAARLATLNAPTGSRLIDAQALAEILGCKRETIYRRQSELGGQHIGDGPRGRLRFDPAVALERWRAEPKFAAPTPAGRRRTQTATVPLLPVRGAS